VLAAAAIGSLVLTACTATQFPPPQAAGPGAIPLAAFDSCEDLLGYLKEEATERVTAWGLDNMGLYPLMVEDQAADSAETSAGGGAAGSDVSGTNNQVEGVDEADVVTTDGEVIVTSVSGRVRVIEVAGGEVVATVAVPGLEDGAGSELLLDGDDLVVLSTQWSGGGWGPTNGSERTIVSRIDLSDPANPEILGTTRVEGSYRSARMIDGTIRLVLVTQPPGLVFSYPEDASMVSEEAALQANRQVIAESTIDDWLPHHQTLDSAGRGSTPELLLDCTSIGRPGQFSGYATVSVATLDAGGDATPSSAAGVVADAHAVYASTDRLIVATHPWQAWNEDVETTEASTSHTDLHTFDIADPAATAYVASGRVAGWLLDQFSIDEAVGVIRVTTTLTPPSSQAPTSSSLVVLAEDGDELVETGRVDGLGETEQVYAVRYLSADVAAVVTFRQTDPLYLIDTSDPASPQQLGELKIPGYSAYLHPLTDGSLLGIGQDADEEGRTNGLQASLFDIGDLSDPQRVSELMWPHTTSAVEWDHRAFLLWEGRVYLPALTHDWEDESTETKVGVITVDVGDGAITEGPRIDTAGGSDPYAGQIARVLVAGDHLWALSSTDAFRFDLETLDGGAVAVL